MTRARTTAPDFEAALAELEQIVTRLERGELSLEESLRQFERGILLTRSCQKALQQAEQKVALLSRAPDGTVSEQEFVPPGDEP